MLKDILEKYNGLDRFTEYDVYLELDTFSKTEPDSFELKAELMAFAFIEDYSASDLGWKTYFGPIIVTQSWMMPSIEQVTSATLEYWQKRAEDVTNQQMKARYYGLVWDFSMRVTCKKASHEIGVKYCNALIETIKQEIPAHSSDSVEKARRSLELALLLNRPDLKEVAVNAIIDLQKQLLNIEEPVTYAFAIEEIILNRKIKLDEKSEEAIVNDLEKVIHRLTSKEKSRPYQALDAAIPLVKYYFKKGNHKQVEELLVTVADSYLYDEFESTPMQIGGWHRKMLELFKRFNLPDHEKATLKKIRENDSIMNESLQSFSVTSSIKRSDIEAIVGQLPIGEKQKIIDNLCSFFIPITEKIKHRLEKVKRKNWMSTIPTLVLAEDGRTKTKIGGVQDDPHGNLIYETKDHIKYLSLILTLTFEEMLKMEKLTVEDLLHHIMGSPLFAPDRRLIIETGLNAYLQGEFLVSAHVLTPQIEAALRRLVELKGGVVYKENKNGGYHLKNLDEVFRDQNVIDHFDESTLNYFKALLSDERGLNLRNEISHGLIGYDFFTKDKVELLIHVLLILGQIRKKPEFV
jgi:hypothetical protein